MKALLFLLISISATAQCNVTRMANSYLALPSFFSLYFTNQCVSGAIRDTTICVKVPRKNIGQLAAFSYSSPSGAPAFVTSVKQYNSACIMIDNTTSIAPGTDTITVCYTIQTTLIDNFCPYMIQLSALAVNFCGVYAYHSDGILHVRWLTCSNTGTRKFEIIESSDATNWRTLYTQAPYVETNSNLSDYNIPLDYNKGGDHYIAIREIDVNGDVTLSDVVYVHIDAETHVGDSYDIIGRRVAEGSNQMYYIKRN